MTCGNIIAAHAEEIYCFNLLISFRFSYEYWKYISEWHRSRSRQGS